MINDHYVRPEWRTGELRAIRDGIGDGLLTIGSDEHVVVLTANLSGSTRVSSFEKAYPDRFFDVGVAEQNMAGVAAGLGLTGLKPYMSSFAAFSPGRNWEQIRVSIALTRTPVTIIGSHAGVSAGDLGPTHQGTEDISLMRVLPNMTVLVPADATQAAAAILASYKHAGPVYIRTARPSTPDFTKEATFEIGKTYTYREGSDVTIAACGICVWNALSAADELAKEGIACEVLNVSSVKPLDIATIVTSARKTGKVITIEDHQVNGGMGSAVAEALAENYPVPVHRIGISDQFGVTGPWEEVYQHFGLDRASLVGAIRTFCVID